MLCPCGFASTALVMLFSFAALGSLRRPRARRSTSCGARSNSSSSGTLAPSVYEPCTHSTAPLSTRCQGPFGHRPKALPCAVATTKVLALRHSSTHRYQITVLDRLHQFDDAVASLLRAMKWRWAGVSENCKSGARGWAVLALLPGTSVGSGAVLAYTTWGY